MYAAVEYAPIGGNDIMLARAATLPSLLQEIREQGFTDLVYSAKDHLFVVNRSPVCGTLYGSNCLIFVYHEAAGEETELP